MEYFYVYQTNSITNTKILLGYNLNKEQKNKLFYSLGREKNSSGGSIHSNDEHLTNGYGCHYKILNKKNAETQLIIKPDEFNKALELINKHGFEVCEKGILNNSITLKSYQSFHKLFNENDNQ